MTAHDEQRFTALFHRHRDAVHAYLLGRTTDRSLAADLLQETFLRLWGRFAEVDHLDEDRQRAWLFTVARNLTIDQYRAAAARPTVPVEDTHAATSGADDPAERAAFADDLDRVDAAIARLPEHLRVVLTMATVAELTSAQIADSLEIPAGTVRARLHEARKRLASAL